MQQIVMLDVSKTGISAEAYCSIAKEKELWIGPALNSDARMVF